MQRVLISAILAASFVQSLVPSAVLAQAPSGSDRYLYEPHMWGGGWGGMVFGPVIMLLVLVVLIAAVVLLIRWSGGPWAPAAPTLSAAPNRTAHDILNERFARGEIDKEEFAERRRVLGD